MKFSIFQESRRGARKYNQDRIAYSYSRDALLIVVADGMGGHAHGEVAAEIAVQYFTEAFRREANPVLSDPLQFLGRTMTGAHHAIVAGAAERGLAQSPLTTCVACVVQDNAACWAHAGDSRLYLVRNGTIVAQTKDHSRVQQLIDQGRMREQAIAAHPERSQIYNCLGSPQPPLLDLSAKTGLHRGDILVLCSDGLWSPLSGRMIGGALQSGDIMKAMPRLLDQAEQRAGNRCDNLSVIAMAWEEDLQAAPADRDSGAAAQQAAAVMAPRDSGAAQAQNGDLSDEEIERAIAALRSSFNRTPNDKT
jgi:serine/threonine protein phosphatase PrpC